MNISFISKYINKKNTPVLPTSKNEVNINNNPNVNSTKKSDQFTIHIKPTFSDQQIKLMEEGKLSKLDNLRQCITYP